MMMMMAMMPRRSVWGAVLLHADRQTGGGEGTQREERATSKAKEKAKAKHRTGETNKNGNEIMQLVA